jgi:hypothetical protein
MWNKRIFTTPGYSLGTTAHKSEGHSHSLLDNIAWKAVYTEPVFMWYFFKEITFLLILLLLLSWFGAHLIWKVYLFFFCFGFFLGLGVTRLSNENAERELPHKRWEKQKSIFWTCKVCVTRILPSTCCGREENLFTCKWTWKGKGFYFWFYR